MKFIRTIGWLSFALSLAVMTWLQVSINTCATPSLDIMALELANREEGKFLLSQWAELKTCHNTTLLAEADRIIRWDFVFIVGYICVLIIVSYLQMQKEPRARLNNLLRLNFPLAIITGLLDATENLFLLYNMLSWNIGENFYPVRTIAIIKFTLAGWAILVWLISLLTAAGSRKIRIRTA
jgi:hypothetical protein